VISERTRDAMAEARSRGVHLGAGRRFDDVIVARITDLSKRGLSWRQSATPDRGRLPDGERWALAGERGAGRLAQVCGCRSGIMIPPGGGAS